jgi:hypothetical protein
MIADRTKMLLILVPVLAVNAFFAYDIHRLASRRETIKQDYSEINSIRYGLLSVESWKVRIQGILADQIGDFKMTKKQEDILSEQISNALNTMITQAETMLKAHQNTFKGKLRAFATWAFVNVPEIRKQVPTFTAAIVAELQTPGQVSKFKKLAQAGIDGYAAKTTDNPADKIHRREILDRYQVRSIDAFNVRAERDIRRLESGINTYCALMLLSALIFLFAWWLSRFKLELHEPLFTLSAMFAFSLLVVGLALPMIDLDARIKSVDFLLWGKHLQFHDQVLFFRSKSILQVVRVLIDTGKPDSIIVGVLLGTFSVLFPICKLIAMERYMRGGLETRRSHLINFFAFRSGKWSMADVTVVAIFISYIGFKGVLNTQLHGINIKAKYVEIIATNDTALQPGFIVFTAFVLFGFCLSAILRRTGLAANTRSADVPAHDLVA